MAVTPAAVQGSSSTPPPPLQLEPLEPSALPSTPPRRRASISAKRLSATVVQGQAASEFRNQFGSSASENGSARAAVDSQQQGPLPLPGAVTSPTSSSTRPASSAPHKVDHTSNDAQGGPATLRARKLSVSTRNLPSSSTSSHQLASPSSATSPRASALQQPQPLMAPTPRTPNRASVAATAPSEVGLGLMLDEDGSHSRQGSLDSDASSALGRAGAAAGIDRWGLETEGDSASASASSSSSSLGAGSVDAFASPSKRSSFGAAAARRGEGLPRLSTVTTANGATSSPLLIFTGSPNPSPSLSTSPRSFSPSPNRSPSPSHTAYNLPSSRSSTPSRPHITSQPMDRTSSSSKSREIHGRQKSLTSACPPVTSSYSGTPEVHQGGFGAVVGGGAGTGAYPPSSPQKGWKVYDWGLGGASSRERSGRGDSDDEDPRIGAKGGSLHHNSSTSALGALLALPSSLLGFFLSPLSATSLHHHSPQLNASTAPTSKSTTPKRYPLLLRLLLVSYLVFSSLFFGLHASSWAAGNDPKSSAASKYLRTRLGPRGADGALLPPSLGEGVEDPRTAFMLSKVGGMGQWAQKMAEGVRWNRGGGAGDLDQDEGALDVRANGGEEVEEWGLVRRLGVQNGDQRLADQNPLSPLSHTYRFAKMHDKIHWDLHDEIVPFTFHASSIPAPKDITACLYSNEAWLSALPAFIHAWEGPVSLVFESAHSRTSPQRDALIESIAALRDSDDLVRKYVDFHVVGTPASMSERTLNKTRERMIERPMAQNYHLNLARFFAPTDIIFLVGDARVLPSPGLKRRLQSETITDLVLERGDAVVVPSFGFVRDPTGDTNNPKTPSLHDLRTKLDLPIPSSPWDGVSAEEFPSLAAEHILSLYDTLPLPPAQWPTKKQSLVTMINTRIPTPEAPTTARLALFDRRWDLNHGPTNWYLWRKSSADPHLHDTPEAGGGTGLGVDGRIGGGRELYRVMDYDLHYAPNVVVSKKGQPWCTERFEQMQSACVYQMYLSGAEMWVLPDEWTYTLEVVEKRPDGWKEDPAEKLKNSISSRLYGKFHQEACMHYGREFLSIQMWDSEKAQHLRETCARTLSTWGMGLVAPKPISA